MSLKCYVNKIVVGFLLMKIGKSFMNETYRSFKVGVDERHSIWGQYFWNLVFEG